MESASSKAAIERERYMGEAMELLIASTNQELQLTIEYIKRLHRIHY